MTDTSSSSSDSGDETFGRKQAFYVPPITKDFDPSKPPQSGEEYLQHVHYESKQLKHWTRSAKNFDRFSKNQTVNVQPNTFSDVPERLKPPLEWQLQQVEDFNLVRQKVVEMKATVKIADIEINLDSNKFIRDYCVKELPAITTILSLKEPQKYRLIRAFAELFEKQIETEICRWFYAVLACIETPLPPEVCSDIRDAARRCCAKRSAMDVENPSSPEIVQLSLLICLISRYFGQLDLADS